MSQYTPPPESQQPPPINPYDSPEAARPGMSSGAKVLIGLGVGCGILVLLCCGFAGFSAFFFGRSFQRAMSTDPATVRRVTDSIVSIDVPADLPPKMSLDWDVPLVGQMYMAFYGDQQDRSNLVLFQLAEDVADAEVVKVQFQQALQQSGGEMEEVELEEPQTVDVEISGETATFSVGKGMQHKSNREIVQATGAFKGRKGAAMLFMQVDAEDFTEEQVIDVIKSMH